MTRYRRAFAKGGTFFFTINTYQRQKILTHPDALAALREAIVRVRIDRPFDIVAWVVLPDHMDLVMTLPEGDTDYSTRLSIIKRLTSQKLAHLVDVGQSASSLRRKESGFWQRRFWEHQIRDDKDFEKHIDYTHYNPVKHGYVKAVKDWPHSTFHRHVALGHYPENWGDVSAMQQGDFGELV
jgi:putative transposase